jgi:hypothetical protein
MFPTGNVTPSETNLLANATLASLFGPTAVLAVVTVGVALLIIVALLIAEFRNARALRRITLCGTPPVAEPVDSPSRVAARQEAA